MNKEFLDLLEKMKVTHASKSADYTSGADPFENFKRAGFIAEWFTDPVDTAFAVLIGVKLARLGSLLSTGKVPNNESTNDSFLDLTTYCGLWASYHVYKLSIAKNE